MKKTWEKHCRKCKTKENLDPLKWICKPCLREYDRLRSRVKYLKEKASLTDWQPRMPEHCGFDFDSEACPLRQKSAKYRAKRGQVVQMRECVNCTVGRI